jgi:hypothetical protein
VLAEGGQHGCVYSHAMILRCKQTKTIMVSLEGFTASQRTSREGIISHYNRRGGGRPQPKPHSRRHKNHLADIQPTATGNSGRLVNCSRGQISDCSWGSRRSIKQSDRSTIRYTCRLDINPGSISAWRDKLCQCIGCHIRIKKLIPNFHGISGKRRIRKKCQKHRDNRIFYLHDCLVKNFSAIESGRTLSQDVFFPSLAPTSTRISLTTAGERSQLAAALF